MKRPFKQITIGIELIDDPAWMGGTLYLRNLAICLARLPENERPKVRLIGATDVVARFLDDCGHLPIFSAPLDTLLGKILRRLGLPARADSPVDVLYPCFGAQIPGAVTMRWIPDFQHRYLPHLFSADEIAARDRSIGVIAERPGVVVLSSESAADDFRRFYPHHQAAPRVWHFYSLLDTTTPSSHATLAKHKLPEKYLYLPNQFWAHKNHITVLKALALLRDEHGLVIPLVCTGAQEDRRNEAHFSSLLQFIYAKGLTGQVHLLGLLDRKDQVDVLRHAAAIVQPSLFEGWSTVVEDVRATGRPIFLSNIPVHLEQNPPHCTYFDAESDKQLAVEIASQWPFLSAGPDPIKEVIAQSDLAEQILSSGRLFVALVQEALNISRLN
jgi:glycosyltransferase involved in cell wall biosynthesis